MVVPALVLVVSTSVAVALANRPSKPVPAPATLPGLGEISQQPDPPTVVVLKEGLFMLTHSSADARTEFGPGLLIVSIPVTEDSFRWLEGPAPASGGRTSPSAKLLSSVPSNLPTVLTYELDGKMVSIFARLASPPVVSGSDSNKVVVYQMSLYDAPGKDSTYTVSGSYDIPETLRSVSLVVSGQVTDQS